MARTKKINATIVWNDLEGGFWGIIDENGNEWLPVNLPEQLKSNGKKARLMIRESEEGSMFMWGTPVKVLAFET
ncbi:MAG: hypothetical protein D6816_07605 [Bacteroidetes bacterium]|mgnify:CR=1 FL=1|nr:hypothetical protein [Saprospirales bacterium]RME06570.1 MAG: hypothetical protein D6816_07605 [Bacteroidota bacterium]